MQEIGSGHPRDVLLTVLVDSGHVGGLNHRIRDAERGTLLELPTLGLYPVVEPRLRGQLTFDLAAHTSRTRRFRPRFLTVSRTLHTTHTDTEESAHEVAAVVGVNRGDLPTNAGGENVERLLVVLGPVLPVLGTVGLDHHAGVVLERGTGVHDAPFRVGNLLTGLVCHPRRWTVKPRDERNGSVLEEDNDQAYKEDQQPCHDRQTDRHSDNPNENGEGGFHRNSPSIGGRYR